MKTPPQRAEEQFRFRNVLGMWMSTQKYGKIYPQIIPFVHRVWNHDFHHPFFGGFPSIFGLTPISQYYRKRPRPFVKAEGCLTYILPEEVESHNYRVVKGGGSKGRGFPNLP